jgi:serine/threonine protein kinase
MAILPGRRLGPYEILSSIGAGGMGEVYRARDTRLNRIVAIKALPTHLVDRSELRERFEREARTIASLNHPHIWVLHDIGCQDGTDYLVMEYLEGETLAQRLVKGSFPLEQVVQYAVEIADRQVTLEIWSRPDWSWLLGAQRRRERHTPSRVGVSSSASSPLDCCHAADPKG